MAKWSPHFYSTQIYDNFLILPEDEAHHALKVLRKKTGDEIIVVDGNGGLYEALFEGIVLFLILLYFKNKVS